MIEVVLRKNRKVIERKVYSDAQFLHQVRYQLLPGAKGRGVWAEMLLEKKLPEEKRHRFHIRIPEGILLLRYVGQ